MLAWPCGQECPLHDGWYSFSASAPARRPDSLRCNRPPPNSRCPARSKAARNGTAPRYLPDGARHRRMREKATALITDAARYHSSIKEVYDAAAEAAKVHLPRTTQFDFQRARACIDAGCPVIAFRRWSQERDFGSHGVRTLAAHGPGGNAPNTPCHPAAASLNPDAAIEGQQPGTIPALGNVQGRLFPRRKG